MQDHGLANIILVEATGCEATAKYVYDMTQIWLIDAGYSNRVELISVEVAEHGANSSLYIRKSETTRRELEKNTKENR